MKYLLLSIFICFSSFSQKKIDYYDYHKQINQAEIYFFMETNVDSSLYIYDKVFQEFEFIFLKDILNAAQIAKFNNKDYQKYIVKSFEFGFKIDDLKSFPLFYNISSKLLKEKNMLEEYKKGRKKYLDKIDFNYLDYIYKIAIQDQIDKYKDDYDNVISKNVKRLIDTIKIKGFPGEKLLGLTDTLIFKEKGLRKININDRARRLKITRHYVYDDNLLYFHSTIPIFLHYNCSYFQFKDVFMEEIKKGNLHPQDLAFINDFDSQYKSKLPNHCNGSKFDGVYRFSPQKGDISEKEEIIKSNQLRKDLFMLPYEVDLKKIEFIKKNKFILYYGFNGARL